MRNSHFATASTLSLVCLGDVRGGVRPALDGGGAASAAGRAGTASTSLTIPQSTLGRKPEDCGPAGPAWTVRLHGRRRLPVPFVRLYVPYTVEATQCNK
jgi:hypothetical protein